MNLKVVLLTRTSRPSGAQMAWRLLLAGYDPLILTEARGKMLQRKPVPGTWFSRCQAPFINLFRQHGFDFLFRRVSELLLIKLHFYCRKCLGKRFKSPAYLSIEELALDYPMKIREVDDHNGPETVRALKEFAPDIGILTNTRRIRTHVLSIPRMGFLNLHASLLPKYAGLEAIFWALYYGEKEVGVTVHFVTEDIDRGDILMQEKIPVTEWDDEISLQRKSLWLGTYLVMEALRGLKTGTLVPQPQSMEGATYYSWPTAKQRRELTKRKSVKRQALSTTKTQGLSPLPSGTVPESHNSQLTTHDCPRILHIITRMTRGGAQENTLATVRGLNQRGYRVLLVTGPSWSREGEILSEALRDGMEMIILPELCREMDPIKDFFAFCKLTTFMKRGGFDLVHTHMSKAGLLGRLAAFFAGVKHIVHTPHGHIFHSYFSALKERFFLFLERRAARLCDFLIALTEGEKREHLELYVGRKDQWVIIPSGVNETLFHELQSGEKTKLRQRLGIRPDAQVAGFVGRLEPVKGPVYFAEAIPAILKSAPQTRFLFVGDGRERAVLMEKVKSLGMEQAVIFTGEQDQISDYFSILNCVVVPSLNEGMGRVIVEAGFLAKPVIASRVGGIPDLITDGQTGLLVPPRDSGAITSAVLRILKDVSYAEKLGTGLQKRVLEKFTEAHMVEAVCRLYQAILEMPAAPSLSEKSKPPVSTM